MPNNTSSIIKFCYHGDSGDKIKEIAEFIKSDDSDLDFNKIIPQPENIFNGPLGYKEKELLKSEGRSNWYDWNIENWGTKWNAYEVKVETFSEWSLVIRFETAWSPVIGIVSKLSELFPDVEITYIACCEGGWFTTFYHSDGEGENTMIEYDKKNDPSGNIRMITKEALTVKY